MKFLKKLALLIIIIIVFLVALLAAVDNSERVSLLFLEFATPALPISWWVLGAFVMGVIFASLLNAWTNTRLRLAARKATKQVSKTNQTLDKVRAESSTELVSQ